MRSDHVAQGFVQSGPENIQGCRLYNLSEQPSPTTDCPRGEKGFPSMWSIPLLFEFMPIVSCVPTMQHCKDSGYIINNLLRGAGRCCSPPPLFLSRLILTEFPHRVSAPDPGHLGGSMLNSLQLIDVFLVRGPPNWSHDSICVLKSSLFSCKMHEYVKCKRIFYVKSTPPPI